MRKILFYNDVADILNKYIEQEGMEEATSRILNYLTVKFNTWWREEANGRDRGEKSERD